VNAWRQRYVRARAAAGVAGFAEFDFRFENNQALVMRDVLGELAQVVYCEPVRRRSRSPCCDESVRWLDG